MISVTTACTGDSTEGVNDDLERDTIGALWGTALKAEFTKPYFCMVHFKGFAPTSRNAKFFLIAGRFLDLGSQVATHMKY